MHRKLADIGANIGKKPTGATLEISPRRVERFKEDL